MSALALLSGGCAERGLITRPDTQPGGGTWAAVWVAGVLAAVLAGALLTLPAWRSRAGARLAVGVLALQAGGVTVVGAVLVGVAVRSWQLVGHPADAAPSIALFRLSRIDGDTAFFALMAASALVVGILLLALIAAAARLAAGSDPMERSMASALLAIEMGASGWATVRLLLGARGLPFLLPALAFPVLGVAFATCWPRRSRG
ncbi:MAG: hypothetical protein ABIY48_01320 [Acidimicrobiales bacterium]